MIFENPTNICYIKMDLGMFSVLFIDENFLDEKSTYNCNLMSTEKR